MQGLRKRLSNITDGLIAAAVFALMVGIGVAIWASIRHMPGPVTTLVSLGAVWFVLEIIVRGHEILIKWQRPKTPEQWAKTVRTWLDKGGLKVQTDNSPPEELFFRFVAEYDGGAMIVVMPKERTPPCILILSKVSLSPNTVARFNGLSSIERMKLSVAFQLELVKFGVEVPKVSPAEVLLQDAILCDGLDEFLFQRRFVFMMRAVVLASLAYRKAFIDAGVTPPVSDTVDSQPQSAL